MRDHHQLYPLTLQTCALEQMLLPHLRQSYLNDLNLDESDKHCHKMVVLYFEHTYRAIDEAIDRITQLWVSIRLGLLFIQRFKIKT